jgi:sterol desaturase/sphingolipid hydroxylase (fatty acid hydroxylase superfamily)
MNELWNQAAELWWGLAIFAAVIPLEYAFAAGTRPAPLERLGNLGAMLLNFVAGGLILNAILQHPAGLTLRGFPDHARFAPFENPIVYGVTAVFLIDGLYYLYHRLQHGVPLLWRIHAIHHSDPSVNITTARRTHFLERPIQFLVLVLPVMWLLGWNAAGMGIMAVVGATFLYFGHMGVRLSLGPLTPFIVGPQYHRLHHALDAHHHGRNFAQAFPLFDILGRTYRCPEKGEFVATGIKECDTARSRWRPILW